MAEASTIRSGVPAVALLAVAIILLSATTADASRSAGNRVAKEVEEIAEDIRRELLARPKGKAERRTA